MDSFVRSEEKVFYALCLVVSILLYFLLVISVFGIVYIITGAIAGLIAHGLLIGRIKGKGVKVSERQFPEVNSIAENLSRQIGLDRTPEIYVVQEGGMLNAFATRFLGRSFVIIYSEILELAYEKGESELAFIIAHELTHIKRKHLSRRMLIYPAMLIPFLGTAYSRACEYTCDAYAAALTSEGSVNGLLILAAGKKLYSKVDSQELINQARQESGFWVSFAELLATHPNLSKRVDAVTIQNFLTANHSNALQG